MRSLADAFNPSENSFGFLRLALATAVLVSHCFPLGWATPKPLELASGHFTDLGALAVDGFFILSGFLIARSMERAPSVGRFLFHRFLRIFPGFWVCLLVCAFGFAPLISIIENQSWARFWPASGPSALAFVSGNFWLTIRYYGIEPLLASVRYPSALNGSLWTLKYEFRCYLYVAILGWAGIIRKSRGLVLALTGLLWIGGIAAHVGLGLSVDPFLLRLSTYFFSGAVFFLYREKIPFNGKWALLAFAALWAAIVMRFLPVAGPVVFSYLMFFLAFSLPLKSVDKHGDFSYGIYLYAFPSQQLLALLGAPKFGFFAYCLGSLALTSLLAVASYFIVEQPALGLKHRSLPSHFFARRPA